METLRMERIAIKKTIVDRLQKGKSGGVFSHRRTALEQQSQSTKVIVVSKAGKLKGLRAYTLLLR